MACYMLWYVMRTHATSHLCTRPCLTEDTPSTQVL